MSTKINFIGAKSDRTGKNKTNKRHAKLPDGRYKSKLREYKLWKGMRQRCLNPNGQNYRQYMSRGIKVCERWNKFENFLSDMGFCPPGMSLDRINNDGDYCPENCRWTDKLTQANNTRRNIYLEVNGIRKTQGQWAREIGKKDYFIRDRLRYGMSLEDILINQIWRRED